MQNNIIHVTSRKLMAGPAIAVALAMSGPAFAAMSDNVTLYGQANVSYDSINTGWTSGIGSSKGITSGRLASNSSHIGIKGSSELGGEWKALLQAEATLGTDTGASGCQVPDAGTPTKSSRWKCFFDRNTYLGLSSDGYGTLLAGRHDTPYKMATRRLDVFADGIADNRSLMGTTIAAGVVTETFDVRLSNLILYMSPNIGSFRVSVGYSNLTESNTYDDQPSGSAVSAAGMYEQGPVYATIAYEDHTTRLKNVSTTVKATKLGLGYKLGIIDLGFAYEKSRDDFGNLSPYDPDPASITYNPCGDMLSGANCSGHGTLYFAAKLHFTDNDAIKMAFTKARQVGAASSNTGASQFAMGLDHDFNERTTGYVLYTMLRNDRMVRYGLSTASTSGDNSVNQTGTGGGTPAVFSIGVRLSF